jgi:hypothetical protein
VRDSAKGTEHHLLQQIRAKIEGSGDTDEGRGGEDGDDASNVLRRGAAQHDGDQQQTQQNKHCS